MRAALRWLVRRPTIRRIAGFGALATLLISIITVFAPADWYVTKLTLWFVLCLFGFHWFFGGATKLTVTGVRLIDYVYLGVAASGVLVLAVGYESRRDAYFSAVFRDDVMRDSVQARKDLNETAISIETEACKATIVKLFPDHCDAAKSLRDTLSRELTEEELEAAVMRYAQIAKAPSPMDEEKSLAYRQLENHTLYLVTRARGMKLDKLFVELQEPLPPDPRVNAFALFTWPFILAFALALRMTRTTIEVLDWTAPMPEPPRLPNELPPLPAIDPDPPSWVQRG
jgi:hypothetical protein